MNRLPDLDMTIDSVTSTDQVAGQVVRREVFNRKAGFRTVHIFIFNDAGELLVQRIGSRNIRHPHMLGSSVAGYLFSGESYEAAAERRLEQELGVEQPKLNWVGKTRMEDEGCHKWIGVFVMHMNGPFRIDNSHIGDVQFFALGEIKRLLDHGDVTFTPTFLHLWNFYLVEQIGREP